MSAEAENPNLISRLEGKKAIRSYARKLASSTRTV